MNKPIKIACPHCQKEMFLDKNNPFRPFCSERCKLIDFGGWINERHAIAGETQETMNDDLINDPPS